MALTSSDKADRKIVNQFLNGNGGQTAASGFLGTLDQDIRSSKQARRAAQRGSRAQANIQSGLGKMRGLGGAPILNPNPSTVTIPGLQRGVGAGAGGNLPVPAGPGTGGQRVGGPTITAGAPRPAGPIPQGIGATSSATTAIGPAGNPGAVATG